MVDPHIFPAVIDVLQNQQLEIKKTYSFQQVEAACLPTNQPTNPHPPTHPPTDHPTTRPHPTDQPTSAELRGEGQVLGLQRSGQGEDLQPALRGHLVDGLPHARQAPRPLPLGGGLQSNLQKRVLSLKPHTHKHVSSNCFSDFALPLLVLKGIDFTRGLNQMEDRAHGLPPGGGFGPFSCERCNNKKRNAAPTGGFLDSGMSKNWF